jgi:hypothetical protein
MAKRKRDRKSLAIPEPEKTWLRIMAERTNVSEAEIVRRLIRHGAQLARLVPAAQPVNGTPAPPSAAG